ncbi:hypothetical protein D6D15_09270, partial [Aureobasidium pullulans]
DGFKPVNAWVTGGIAWLDDIQAFYRERSAIEKEYSQKLNALAKKYFDKKIRKQSSLSVGDTPTVTPGSLESASMTTWATQLTTLENRASEHDRFATQLISHLADPIKNLSTRCEDLRKHHADYAAKLEKERDNTYADLRKTKTKYDSVCQDVENRRKKIDSSFDHGKTKAQSAYVQIQADMRNTKNTYLISINVTNKQKERYYHEYVPDLLDSLQDLSETRVAKLNTLWLQAATIETQTLSRSTQLLENLSAEIPRNNPVLDSMMFVRHNAANWQDPADFSFEPSPVWLDDDVMASDDLSKTFLRNIMMRSKGQLNELRRECDAKRREVEGAKRVRQAIRDGTDKRDEVEVVRAQFNLQESLHEAERKKVTCEVEVSTIATAVGDLSIGAQNHAFKSQTFKLPTNCDLCGDRLWGLSAKGFDCEDCGFICHSKCQMKVPANCPGPLDKEQKKKIKAERQATASTSTPAAANPVAQGSSDSVNDMPRLNRTDTMGSMNTLSSGYAASANRSVSGTNVRPTSNSNDSANDLGRSNTAKRRILAPPPDHYANGNGDSGDGQPRGKMMYPYQASGDGEISVDEGAEVTIVEPDGKTPFPLFTRIRELTIIVDGVGWMKVRTHSGEGLVPASYVEAMPSSPVRSQPGHRASITSLATSIASSAPSMKKKGPAVAPKRGAKKLKYVEALYTYAATGEGEASMDEGEKLVLIAPDQGDGWCEVERSGGQGKGLVPAGWVREV